ncbi:MAG: SAM-dependent methyltransferase [Actinobacteria bacterium]|nr:SAM-dependent methyltransferase [Actinomycetota bacterium]
MTAQFDTAKPNSARMYDYWLGGKDNFEADRVAAEAVRALRPNVAEQALDNKRFQTRAVGYLAEQGVRQYLDVGSGLPTSPHPGVGSPPRWRPTHEAAAAADPLVAYVDYDPVAVLHSQVLLAGGSRRVVAVQGDMRDPAAILGHDDIREAGLDLDAPVGLVLACVLHFVDAGTARDIVAAFTAALSPGSYVIASVGYEQDAGGDGFARTYNSQAGPRIYAHSWAEITALFDGLELIPPGIADTAAWRPGGQETGLPERSSMIVGGVGRKAG